MHRGIVHIVFITTQNGYNAGELVENKISYCGLTFLKQELFGLFPPSFPELCPIRLDREIPSRTH